MLHMQCSRHDDEPKVQVKRLHIDNRDRSSGDAFDFEVLFGNAFRENVPGVVEYRNVVAVELKLLSFPKVVNEPYVVMDVAELNNTNLDTTNKSGTQNFAVCFFDAKDTGEVSPLEHLFTQKVIFNPPLSRLDRLTIKFKKQDGSIVTPTDTGGKSTMSMMMEVSTMCR